NDLSKSVVAMNSWLEKPAGKHGFVQSKGDALVFEDGTPIKFWGANISANDAFPTHEDAEIWSNTLSSFGINAVRFHKYSFPGMKKGISTQLDDEKFEKLDFFSAELKEKGVYYGWSPIYGHKPQPGDSIKLVAYNEIVSGDSHSHLANSTTGLVNFAEDIQDLQIELIVNMLNHKNPYTGLKYADDTALMFIEIQNEDDIFFSTTELKLSICPTYKAILTKGFNDWLKVKYKNQANLEEKWGKDAFKWGNEIVKTNWNLDSMNISPIANHGIYNYEFNKAAEANEPLPLFLTDMANYLYSLQQKYYDKVTLAIKNTGYKGVIISSNWQAGSGIAHYLNLYSDYKTGIIDRHNYYGGGTGHTLKPGDVLNDAMVSKPGSGLLSTGMQQVSGVPFAFTEWMSLAPNEWRAESSPLIAVYGMGLQGWDASFVFGSENKFYTPTVENPNKWWPGVYNAMTPSQLALYPALARMVYRNDIEEGKVVSKRYVSKNDLEKGELGFKETINQVGDVKSFDGSVPSEILGIGKVEVEFTVKSKKTKQQKLSKYWDKDKKTINSTT
ncbi:MAG: hypothetical protein KAG37_04820, partial [Flavobacteriales bacterium]|nr:hypothetical protein [Flavobacteriales bacterium]